MNGWRVLSIVVEEKLGGWLEDQGFVLVARPAQHVKLKWEYLTAKYNHDKGRWEDPSGYAIQDSGEDVVYYKPLPHPPEK